VEAANAYPVSSISFACYTEVFTISRFVAPLLNKCKFSSVALDSCYSKCNTNQAHLLMCCVQIT